MPLLDLSQESTKPEPVQDPFGSPDLQRQRYDAALEFDAILHENFSAPNGKAHAGTILSVAAWLVGTSLYRSLRYSQVHDPGTFVHSSEVNEDWQALMNLFLYYCQRNGIELKPDQLILRVPEEHKPQIDLPQAQEKFQDLFNRIMKKYGLDYLEGARAGIIVCSMEFYYYCTHARAIDPNVAAGIISMGILAGAKSPPLAMRSECSKPDQTQTDHPRHSYLFDVMVSIAQNSTAGAGTRLVLGEGRASMQEALNRGGKYIRVHPDVLSLLRANNLDVFLVYAAAMQKEISSGIPQIDFAGADVDRLLQQWNGTSEAEAPIHVRQVKWLKDNAVKSGYVRCGNSWLLKH